MKREQFQGVADGDIGNRAAFGGDDDGGAMHDVSLGCGANVGIVVAQFGSRANPSTSRMWAMHRARAPPRVTEATNQGREGRTMSAQIATVSAAHKRAFRPLE